jgi:hypothetical protein
MSGREVFKSRTFARDRRTWIATLVAAAFLWAGTSAWLNRRVVLAGGRPAGPDVDGRFVVLAFDRIVSVPDGRNLDRLRLREELRALASAGWHAVTLGQLQEAYRGNAPLPSQPIVLTFDEGYLGNYEAADPVLRELRWPAVMFLRTERQESRDASFLFWDRLQRMKQSGLWEIASGDPAGPRPGLPAGGVPPDPPGAGLIADRLGKPTVVAWAPRGTEPLVAFSCVAAGDRAWHDGVPFPWLGFVDDPIGANDPTGNPFRIARLRVDPRWTTAELLRWLEIAVASPDPGGAASWVPGEGEIHAGANDVRLLGHPRAEIWIPSARWIDNWVLDVRLLPSSGEFWIVQPGGIPGREWRFGGVDGALYLEDVKPGEPPEVLARASFSGRRGDPHRVRVVKRGSGVFVTWDERPLTPVPIALPERWRGRVGLLAYGAVGAADLTVEGVRLSSQPYSMRTVSASPTAEEVAGLAREATAIAALSPEWATIDGRGVRETSLDRDLFRILARRYAWDIVPTVTITGAAPPGGPAADWLADLAARVSRDGYAGVRLDLGGAASDPSQRWSAVARELDLGMRRAGKRLVVVAR